MRSWTPSAQRFIVEVSKMKEYMEIDVFDEELEIVTGGFSERPYDCGGEVDQYAVIPGNDYYYHYDGGGHDQWIDIHVVAVYEKTKVLWFTERFAVVRYATGMLGELPLDTNQIFYRNC